MTHICDPDEGYCRVTREKVVRVGLDEWVCGYEPPYPSDDRPQHADNGVEPSSEDDSQADICLDCGRPWEPTRVAKNADEMFPVASESSYWYHHTINGQRKCLLMSDEQRREYWKKREMKGEPMNPHT